jgi:hypothetical protein
MKGYLASAALVLLAGSVDGLRAADSESFTGTASATGKFKRPLLIVDGKGYELKASDKADAKVAGYLDILSRQVTVCLSQFTKGKFQHEEAMHRFRCASSAGPFNTWFACGRPRNLHRYRVGNGHAQAAAVGRGRQALRTQSLRQG